MPWKKLKAYPNQKVEKPSYDSSIVYWKIEDGTIWHQWKKLPKADLDSFEVYSSNDFIARDKDFVYYAWTKKSIIDRDTFKEIGDSYWVDKNLAYTENETSITQLKGKDAESFHYLGNGYAFDKYYAYYFGKVLRSCEHPLTLKIITKEEFFAKDIENVYCESAILKGANSKTWKMLSNGYSQDENKIYFMAKKLPRVDSKTWEHIFNAYSKDKNYVYNMHLILKGEQPKDWSIDRAKEVYSKQKLPKE